MKSAFGNCVPVRLPYDPATPSKIQLGTMLLSYPTTMTDQMYAGDRAGDGPGGDAVAREHRGPVVRRVAARPRDVGVGAHRRPVEQVLRRRAAVRGEGPRRARERPEGAALESDAGRAHLQVDDS